MGNSREGRGRGGFGERSGSRFGGRSGGAGGFGNRGGGFSRGRDSGGFSGRAEMHDAVCSKCGKPCQVPFRPTGSKPVFCSDCFRQNEGGSSFTPRNNDRQFSSGASSGASSEQFTQINAKLDKILKVLQELEIDVEDSDEPSEEESEDSDEK